MSKFQGCQSGVRSVYATSDLLDAVSLINPFRYDFLFISNLFRNFYENIFSSYFVNHYGIFIIIIFISQEFKCVLNMGGGYIAWVGNGFAVRKSDNVEMD